MVALSLAEGHRAARFHAALARVRALDTLWTSHLERATSLSAAERNAIKSITDEMLGELPTVARFCRWLDRVLASDPRRLEATCIENLNTFDAPKKVKLGLQRRAQQAGGLVQLGRASAAELLRRLPEERKGVQAKVRVITRGDHSPGDMTKDFWCKVAAGCMVAGLAGGQPEFFGFGVAVAVVLDC